MEILVKIWDWIVAAFTQYVATPVLGFRVIDAIDVLLLAAVLFSVYRFFKDRRAARVLIGLSLIVVGAAVVSLFELPALTYIIRLFAAAFFFCVVVIFQPEFRDALESLGNIRLLNPRSRSIRRKHLPMAKAVVDETVDAVFKMSRKKVGALIVFEGLTKLGDYTKTGTKIDAEITSKLLRNIFYGHAPLHDGAVIIRQMRVHAASCVLPSSTRNGIDFGLMGTRHRAAVGITEVSDALVVVVSEQTGIVSVAQDGKLLRELDEKILTDILMTYIAGNAYLRYKRANMRSDYLKMMEEIGQVKPVVEDEDLDQMEWQFSSDETEESSAAPKKDVGGDGDSENL